MDYGIIVAPTMKELFVNRIEDMILSGKLSAGDKLPTERELAEETRVSKSVVHTGLVELAKMGFVLIMPRKGVIVANYAETGTLETLTSLLRHNGGKLTRHQVESLFETRLAIEGAALRKLASSHTKEDIRVLNAVIDDAAALTLLPQRADYEKMAEAVFRFHHAVCLRSGNLMFPLILNAFKSITLVFWETYLKMASMDKYLDKLKRYVSFIESGDGDGAVKYLASSLGEYLKFYN